MAATHIQSKKKENN